MVLIVLLASSCGHASAANAPGTVNQEPGRSEVASYSESGGGSGAQVAAPTGTAERLVITGNVAVRTIDVAAMVRVVREHTAAVGGTVVSEVVEGNAEEGHATLQLRLPPAATVSFVDWLGTQATVESRAVETADVSRAYVDQELAIKNLKITMARLQDLAGRRDAQLKDVLEVERELTRVRGEIERIEGEHRLLGDRIARATLTVRVLPKRGAHPPDIHVEPELKFELVPHLTVLHFLDAGSARAQTRAGGGATLMFSRALSLDISMLPRHQNDARSFLFDASVAGHSDFLGGGRRRFGNPYLGLRAGGGSVNTHGVFTFGAEVGVELVRYKLFLVDVAGRALGFIYGRGVSNDVVLEGTLGVGVPF